MKKFLPVLAILGVLFFLTDPVQAEPPRFVVTNKCGCEFNVVNSIPASVHKAPVLARFRAPRGHTHTCTSCGQSWDHEANASHKCLNCGGHPPISGGGYVTDSTPKMIRIEQSSQAAKFQVAAKTALPAREAFVPTYSIPGVSAGSSCANGQCSTPQSTGKFRLFR